MLYNIVKLCHAPEPTPSKQHLPHQGKMDLEQPNPQSTKGKEIRALKKEKEEEEKRTFIITLTIHHQPYKQKLHEKHSTIPITSPDAPT